MAVLCHPKGGLRWSENFWLCLTAASQQCLRILQALFFHYELSSTTLNFCIVLRISMQCMQNATLFYQFRSSVRPMPVLCPNERTYHHIFSSLLRGIIILVFYSPTPVTKFKNNGEWENFESIILYLENSMRQAELTVTMKHQQEVTGSSSIHVVSSDLE